MSQPDTGNDMDIVISPLSSPAMSSQELFQEILGKRKHDDDENDNVDNGGVIDDNESEDSLFIPDENAMVPDDFVMIEDDDNSGFDDSIAGSEDDSDGEMDEADAPVRTYSQNEESFPKCAIYDDELPKIISDFTNAPKKIQQILEAHDCQSYRVKTQRETAHKLSAIPSTKKLRVALLGDAGAGKSSVLNSLSDISDLAKSLSGGQSCTCVNRRSVTILQRPSGSSMAIIAVGAMLVGSIRYNPGIMDGSMVERGQCLGAFLYGGSTVIILYPEGGISLDDDLVKNSTEQNGAFPKQKRNFAAHIRYFEIKKIQHLLKELLEDYNFFTFERDEEWDEETFTIHKRKMQHALKTFQVLFCDMPEFEDSRAAKETLKKAYHDRTIRIVESMMESCEKKLKTKINADGGYTEYREASTRAKLREAVDPLMSSDASSKEPALWPLVKQVCIGVRGSKILDRLTVIDLPGISDTNETRVNLCKEYVKTCDYVWIVAHISRVIDDGTVFQLLSKYGKVFKGKVLVICTHSDDGVDPKLVKYLENQGQDMTGYRELRQRCRAIRTHGNQLNARVKIMRNHKTQTKQKLLDREEKETELKTLRGKYADLEVRSFVAMVEARNNFVTEQLQMEMEDNLPEGKTLDVFCVSNSHYAAAKGGKTIRGPNLSAQATGIPALRTFTLTLPAPKLLQTLQDYSYNTMMVFLKNAALWANKTGIDQREDLMAVAREPLTDLNKRLSARLSDLNKGTADIIADPMRNVQREAGKQALKVFSQKSKKHPSTIRAFIRKDGQHATKMCPKECWNEQFSKTIIDLATTKWAEFESYVTCVTTKLRDNEIADLRSIVETLGQQSCASSLPMERLSDLIEAHVVGIKSAFRDDREAYETDLRNLLLDVTQHSDKNYFSKTIQPVYDRCNEDSGAGITKRSMGRIEAHLKKSGTASPFAITQRNTAAALIKNDAKHVNTTIKEAVEHIFKETIQSVDGLIDRTVDDPTEKPVREHLKSEIHGITRAFMDVQEELERVKAKYEEQSLVRYTGES